MFEKEAEEWIKDHSGLIGSYKFVKYDYDSMQKAYFAGAKPRDKHNEDLEKEIAKLKHNKKTVVELSDCLEKLYKSKLAQAKDLIRELLRVAGRVNIQFDCVDKAEQFLKENETFLSGGNGDA